MATRVIASFTSDVQKNCAWAISLHFTNSDNSDFDLSSGTLTGQVRSAPANDSTHYADMTMTITSATGGVATAALSAHDTGLLPAPGQTWLDTKPVWAEINFIPNADPHNPICIGRGLLQVSPGGNAVQTAAAAPTVPLETINLVVGAVSAAAARQMIGIADPDYAKLIALAPDGWLGRMSKQMAAAAPGVTMTIPIDIRNMPRSSSVVNPSAATGGSVVQGGGVVFYNTPPNFTPDAVIGAPRTQPWAFTMRCRLRIPTVANDIFRMRVFSDGDNFYEIQQNYGVNTTKLVLNQYNAGVPTPIEGTPGWTIDEVFHDFMIAGDTQNVKMYVDNTLIAQSSLSGAHGALAACSLGVLTGNTNQFIPVMDAAYAV